MLALFFAESPERLEHGAVPNLQSDALGTPEHVAARNPEDDETIPVLLEEGALPPVQNRRSEAPAKKLVPLSDGAGKLGNLTSGGAPGENLRFRTAGRRATPAPSLLAARDYWIARFKMPAEQGASRSKEIACPQSCIRPVFLYSREIMNNYRNITLPKPKRPPTCI